MDSNRAQAPGLLRLPTLVPALVPVSLGVDANASVDETTTEPPVTAIEPGTRVLVMGAGTWMYMGILTQIFPRTDNHTAISDPRCMGLGPSPVNRLFPTLIMGTTLSKDQGTTPLLVTVNANTASTASVVIVTGSADVATDIPNPIPMVYPPRSPILTLPGPPPSCPGPKASL